MAEGGGKVTCSEGTFTLAATIEMTTVFHMVLQGQGRSTILDANDGDRPVIDLGDGATTRDQLEVRDLLVRGGGRTNTSAHGIRIRDVTHGGIFNCTFHECRNAVDITDPWQFFLENVRVSGTLTSQNHIGIYTHVPVNDDDTAVVAHHVHVVETASDGFRLEHLSGSKWVSCEAGGCGASGWNIGDPAGADEVEFGHFVNCVSDNNIDDGWRIVKGANGTECRALQFSNCWSGSNDLGFYFNAAGEITLNGIHLKSHNEHGMQFENGCFRISITGGVNEGYGLTGTAQWDGINLGNTVRSQVVGVHIFGGAAGVRDSIREETGADNNIIVANTAGEGVTTVGASTVNANNL